MFKIFTGTNFIILILAVKNKNEALILTSVFIFFILSHWFVDKENLIELKSKINNVPSKTSINIEAFNYATKDPNLKWLHKIISIRAFKAGAEFILNKLK